MTENMVFKIWNIILKTYKYKLCEYFYSCHLQRQLIFFAFPNVMSDKAFQTLGFCHSHRELVHWEYMSVQNSLQNHCEECQSKLKQLHKLLHSNQDGLFHTRKASYAYIIIISFLNKNCVFSLSQRVSKHQQWNPHNPSSYLLKTFHSVKHICLNMDGKVHRRPNLCFFISYCKLKVMSQLRYF